MLIFDDSKSSIVHDNILESDVGGMELGRSSPCFDPNTIEGASNHAALDMIPVTSAANQRKFSLERYVKYTCSFIN